MTKTTARDFWLLFREEIRRTGSLDTLKHSTAWTCIAIKAAKRVCKQLGLKTCHELHLDTMGYEQRQKDKSFDWDLRVAFEHENNPNQWHDELCKLCHVVADLRVLVGYFSKGSNIQKRLQSRIDQMGNRMVRVPNSEWLFVFGPVDSEHDSTPWAAFTLDSSNKIFGLDDSNPFNPYCEFTKSQN